VIVLDASAAVEFLLLTPIGSRVQEKILADGESVHAPHLLDVEVVQVVRQLAATGLISIGRAKQAVEDLLNLSLIRHPHVPWLSRIWELRHNLTAYDATYICIAEALDAPLLTCDRKLARATNHHAKVEVI
jgi:predicted nucleic acid-binding protein